MSDTMSLPTAVHYWCRDTACVPSYSCNLSLCPPAATGDASRAPWTARKRRKRMKKRKTSRTSPSLPSFHGSGRSWVCGTRSRTGSSRGRRAPGPGSAGRSPGSDDGLDAQLSSPPVPGSCASRSVSGKWVTILQFLSCVFRSVSSMWLPTPVSSRPVCLGLCPVCGYRLQSALVLCV